MTQAYEIVFFSLQPGCCLEAIEEALCRLLEQKEDRIRRALRHSGSVLIGGLSEAEAKSLQIRLVASGLLCNYRPTSPPCELRLKPKSFTMPCPHCGRPNQIIENERRRRCRYCRKFWSLWAMRQEKVELSPTAVPNPSRPQSSWLIWSVFLLLISYFVIDGLPPVQSLAKNAWRSVYHADNEGSVFLPANPATMDSSLQPVFDPFELAWLLDSSFQSGQANLPQAQSPEQTPSASTCAMLAQLCQTLEPLGIACRKHTNQTAIAQ